MLTTYKKGSERRLIDILGRLKEQPGGHWVVHFKFSNLFEHHKTEYQAKISVNIINDILAEAEGYLVLCSDYDIIIACRSVVPNTIKKLIFQLRYLYMDDPLAYNSDSTENEEFCTTYDLKPDWQKIFTLVREKIAKADEDEDQKPKDEDPHSLTPSKLIGLENGINKTNIASAFRSQPVCATKQVGFKEMYNEVYINMAALSFLLRTNVDFGSDRNLFRYLTNILDRKMLEYISKNIKKHTQTAISINLNVSTVLSESFTEFDSKIDPKLRKNIVVEIQVADVFTDMQAFIVARDMLQNLGYRICLDGLTSISFTQVDRSQLGFDLAKIFWNADLKSDSKNKQNKQLAEAIEKCGKTRVILARCDDQDAIYYGQSIGVSLFQGRYIDAILDPTAEIVN